MRRINKGKAITKGILMLPGDDRVMAGRLSAMHVATLLGLLFPLLGHVIPVLLFMFRESDRKQDVCLSSHLSAALDFNVFWGIVSLVLYFLVWMFGLAVLPLCLLAVVGWVVQVCFVAHRIEGGVPGQYLWYIKL
ncbi:MAG: DUF4870 domain-containing protein [Planctomycetes bacterium]|nr:DUF4870 domain-containing protein [Planctomycetota bacterium]